MIKLTDILADGSTYEISLVKMTGKQIKDIRGYITSEYGSVMFKATSIILEDDSEMGVEGEHDLPYLTTYPAHPQPNFDEETLERLYEEEE